MVSIKLVCMLVTSTKICNLLGFESTFKLLYTFRIFTFPVEYTLN